MSLRHEARRWALQFLFQSEFNQADSLNEGLRLFWKQQDEDSANEPTASASANLQPSAQQRTRARQFAEELIRGVIAHHREIDPLIAQYAENWDMERMGTVDRNVMRIAVYEMLHREDIPPVVSINEAVELAKAFSSTESGAFVNGILDRIRQGLDRTARGTKEAPSKD